MIDWSRIAALRAEIGQSDFAEVVEMFLSESDEVIARLRLGRPQPTLEAELHFLKGSALNLGFTELAALCNDGELQVSRRFDLSRILSSYEAARAEFRIGLNLNSAA